MQVYDLIIVGSGPAGIVICNELVQNGIRNIAVIEEGDEKYPGSEKIIAKSDVIPFKKTHKFSMVGGALNIWGRTLSIFDQLDSSDFSQQDLDIYKVVLKKYFNLPLSSFYTVNHSSCFGDKKFIVQHNKSFLNKNFLNVFKDVDMFKNCKIISLDITNSFIVISSENGKKFKAKKLLFACGGISNNIIMNKIQEIYPSKKSDHYAWNHLKAFVLRFPVVKKDIDKLSRYLESKKGNIYSQIGLTSLQKNLNYYVRLQPYYIWEESRLVNYLRALFQKLKKGNYLFKAVTCQKENKRSLFSVYFFNFYQLIKFLLHRLHFIKAKPDYIKVRLFVTSKKNRFTCKGNVLHYDIELPGNIQNILADVHMKMNNFLKEININTNIEKEDHIRFEESSHYMGGTSVLDNAIDRYGRFVDNPDIYFCGTSTFTEPGISNPTLAMICKSYLLSQTIYNDLMRYKTGKRIPEAIFSAN